jgi:hypothetical protein
MVFPTLMIIRRPTTSASDVAIMLAARPMPETMHVTLNGSLKPTCLQSNRQCRLVHWTRTISHCPVLHICYILLHI